MSVRMLFARGLRGERAPVCRGVQGEVRMKA